MKTEAYANMSPHLKGLFKNYPKQVVSIDFETSGLVSKYDSITSAGAAEFNDGEVVGIPFQTRINAYPSVKFSMESLVANVGPLPDGKDGLSAWASRFRDIYKGGIEMPEAAESFAKWLKDGRTSKPFIAYNASFDCGFYADKFGMFKDFKNDPPGSPIWIDVLTMFRQAFPGRKASLREACEFLDLPAQEAHTGHDELQDAILAARVYFRLLELSDE